MAIDLEGEVIRSGPIDHGSWTIWTYQFKPLYPRGKVKKVTLRRRAGFEINVIIDVEGGAPTRSLHSDQWPIVEAEIKRVLREYNCRPFQIDES
jgi:hypothetical protein